MGGWAGWLFGWWVVGGWLVDGLVGWLADWLAGWLVGWLLGWLGKPKQAGLLTTYAQGVVSRQSNENGEGLW